MQEQSVPMAPQRHTRRRRLLLSLAILAGVVLVIGLSIGQPASEQLGQRILLRNLYVSVAASELPVDERTTLWEVDGLMAGGPQQKLCTNYDGPEHAPSKDLYFRNGEVSAWYSRAGYPGALPVMRYSEYAQAPAFYDDIFKGAASETVRTMLVDATLTNKDGMPLAAEADVEAKTSGTYDIYASLSVAKENNKEYIAACSQLMLHITIDAKTQLYAEIAVYKDRINPANLSFSQTQSVKTSSPTFEQALPLLEVAGFNLAQAKSESNYYTYARLVNKAAGFEFSYAPSVLGEPKLTEIRDSSGRATEYSYTFSAQPAVRTTIRTAASTAAPHAIDDLRALIVQKGWIVTTDSQGDDSNVPGCRPGDKEWFLGANDDAMEHNLFARTCGPFPSVYTEMPIALRSKFLDPIARTPVESTPIAGFSHFAPGSEPLLMH